LEGSKRRPHSQEKKTEEERRMGVNITSGGRKRKGAELDFKLAVR
jgi:hypothetical protein